MKEKRIVGQPRKFVAQLLSDNEIKQENKKGIEVEKDPKCQKSRGKYTNWFQLHLYPSILVVIKMIQQQLKCPRQWHTWGI